MPVLSRRELLASLLAAPALTAAGSVTPKAGDWMPLFDGRSLNGWKANENAASFRVVDGAIQADGPRSHLFYAGPFKNADFKNFVFKADVKASHAANSGLFFHTRFQDSGWPDLGFEVQVNNTATGDRGYSERKKTASLYGVRDVYKQFIRDDEWFRLQITVRNKRVEIHLNDMLVVDYVEPAMAVREGVKTGRVLDRGTFAIQCHDPGSKASYKNLVVAPLPDDTGETSELPTADAAFREILSLHARNFPVVDYHVHVRGGFTLEDALHRSRRTGIGYGIAVNCGLNFPVTTDAQAEAFIRSMKTQPAFIAMQGEGREWVKTFSKATIAKFDYVFTDSMTFTDDDGKRMRIWLPEEVGVIPDKQRFMETYVARTVGVLNQEPVDIYVNPTFLPDQIATEYAELWTIERMDRVIAAAKKNDIAIEINNRYKIPSAAFIKRAKAAGLKFSFGTNNTDANLGLIEYGREMVRECALTWQDFFVPKADGEKPVQRRG